MVRGGRGWARPTRMPSARCGAPHPRERARGCPRSTIRLGLTPATGQGQLRGGRRRPASDAPPLPWPITPTPLSQRPIHLLLAATALATLPHPSVGDYGPLADLLATVLIVREGGVDAALDALPALHDTTHVSRFEWGGVWGRGARVAGREPLRTTASHSPPPPPPPGLRRHPGPARRRPLHPRAQAGGVGGVEGGVGEQDDCQTVGGAQRDGVEELHGSLGRERRANQGRHRRQTGAGGQGVEGAVRRPDF